MTIRVNEQVIDIQMQDEKNVWDVVGQLLVWLREQGFVLTGLAIDGEIVDLESEQWRDRPIEVIGDVSLSAASLADLRKGNLELLRDYSIGLNQSLLELSNGHNTIASVQTHLESYPLVRPAMVYLSGDPGTNASDNPLSLSFDQILARSSRSDSSFNTEILAELASSAHSLLIIAQDRLKEIENPIREAHSTGLLLQAMMEDLSMVSTRILTGKGREAYDTILRFSEFMSKLLRLFWLMVESQAPDQEPPFSRADLQNWTITINETLEQISDALNKQDTVLLGDILEYELPAQIDRLIALIPSETGE